MPIRSTKYYWHQSCIG